MSGPRARVEVVLLRHGETAWNLENRFQGQHDTELSDVGRTQAEDAASALGAALAGAAVRLVSSDLSRARDTAAALAGRLGIPVVLDARVREVHAGVWQGLVQEQIAALDPAGFAAWRAGDDIPLGGAERPSDAGRRLAAAVRDHGSGLAAGTVLVVVGHGAGIRAGVALLLDQPALRPALQPLGNTASALLGRSPDAADSWRLHGWNVPPSGLESSVGSRATAPAAVP